MPIQRPSVVGPFDVVEAGRSDSPGQEQGPKLFLIHLDLAAIHSSSSSGAIADGAASFLPLFA